MLGSESFSNALATFTVAGDTTNVYYQFGDSRYPTLSNEVTSITVPGVGTAVVTDPLLVFDNQEYPGFFIDEPSSLGGGNVLTIEASAFGSYTLQISSGQVEVSGAWSYMDGQSEPPYHVNTTLGVLQFSSDNLLPATFIAEVVPPQPPRLSISVAGTNVVLIWSTNNAAGFSLQSATNSGSSFVWSTISNTPPIVGSNYCATNAITLPVKLYRLSN
jgi:hypothetical protein